MKSTKSIFPAGFSFVEVVIVLLVGSILLLIFQTFFSQSVKGTMKGTDLLESIRAASSLFSQIRKDLRGCMLVDTGNASYTMAVGENTLPVDLSPYTTDSVAFNQRIATVTYFLRTEAGGGGYIVRQVTSDTNPSLNSEQFLAIPRVASFSVLHIFKEQQLNAAYDVFMQGQLFVSVEIESQDHRFPAGRIRLGAFFITSQMSETTWWNYEYQTL